MNFNLDDPLGDLLSDNDDASEDSFAKILKQKPNAGAGDATNAANRSKVSSLFGITPADDADDGRPVSTAAAAPAVTPKPPPPAAVSKPPSPIIKKTDPSPGQQHPRPAQAAAAAAGRKEISFDDDDDLFADLGFDPKKPKTAVKKPPGAGAGILDDLLGIQPEAPPSRSTPSSRPTTAAGSGSRTPTGPSGLLTRQPSTHSITAPSTMGGRPKPVTAARPNADPLGLFSALAPSDPAPSAKPAQQPPAATRKSSSVDWLGISGEPPSPAPVPPSQLPPDTASTPPAPVAPVPTAALHNLFQPTIAQTAQLLAHTAADSDAAVHHLQQQETQLLVATQMRQQEATLLDMQRRQQAMLQQQEQHFSTLLQTQLQRQHTLEQNIRDQQERINAHINVLMQQPAAPAPTPAAAVDAAQLAALAADAPAETLVELRVDIKRLEMENLRLADLCEHSKDNHDRELELMERTHAKQLALVESGAAATEQRLRAELAAQALFFGAKLQLATDELHTAVAQHDQQLAASAAQHADQLAQLRQRHADELQQTRNDHGAAVEAMRRSRQLENAVVQENSSYLQTLRSAAGFLETAGGDLHTIRAGFEQSVQLGTAAREAELGAREQRLADQLAAAAKQRESTEAERTALLELVRTLETQLQTAAQQSDEAQWSFRQQTATLAAERAAFERERQWQRDRLAGDETRVQTWRDEQTAEFRRQQQQLADERRALLAERAKLETLERLQRPDGGGGSGSAGGTSRTEIDAAVRVAQDAAAQCDRERERLLEAQRHTEQLKRDLVDREAALRDRQSALDEQRLGCEQRERTAAAKVTACRAVEQRLLERVAAAQRAQHELTAREQRCAQERLDVSRERLELQAVRGELYRNRCSLCKIGERSKELGEMLTRKAAAAGGPEVRAELELRDDVDAMLEREVNEELGKMGRWDEGGGLTDGAGGEAYHLDADLLLVRLDAMGGDLMD